MKVLVTGGAGRLGRSVVGELATAGHRVVAVDRVTADGVLGADLADGEATRALVRDVAPDAIVHLAAIAVPFSAPEATILRTNTTIAMSVLEAAVDAGVGRVLAASSPTVIGYGAPTGWTPASLPLDEDHPRRPWNAYALSKVVIEELVAMFARSTPAAVFGAFRPCYVIAPEEWEGAPTQQGHTVAERLASPELAAGSLFNYVDARDVGRFIDVWLREARPEISGETFFVGAEDALVRGDVPTELARAVPATARAAAALGPHDPVFSSEKAARLLGWRPTRTWRSELRDPARS